MLVSLSNSEKDEDKKLLDLVSGVAFFGVPHNGMDDRSLIPMVQDRSNRFLLESLSYINPQVLDILHHDFRTTLGEKGKLDVFYFYETKESPTAQQVRA